MAWLSASPSLSPYSQVARSLEVPSIQPSVSALLLGRLCSRAVAGQTCGSTSSFIGAAVGAGIHNLQVGGNDAG